MSDNRTVKTIYMNTETNAVCGYANSAFTVLSSDMSLYRGTQVLFRSHLLMSDGTTYYTAPTGASWLFGIDDTFERDHADLVESANDQFIPDDWESANFTNGKVCWRADLSGEALKTALGSLISKTMYACLWILPVGGAYSLVAQWNVTMKNIAVEP